jgi:nucleoside recognition membrane protein YjiH
MKALFGVGLVVLILGILLLFVPIPHTEQHGIKTGDVSLGVQTRTNEKISPAICAVIILVGGGLMIFGRTKT